MPYRFTSLRIVDPNDGSCSQSPWPCSLFRVALSAAEEIIQGAPLASAWLQLFQAHLSQEKPRFLCWQGDLAESTEMRRAYSALYGRFFGRALLDEVLGVKDFVPLNFAPLNENGVTIPCGSVKVQRTARGDIPDWIAWCPTSQSYVLAEAKGRLTGNESVFWSGTPSCIGTGKAQLGRVRVIKSDGTRVATRDWIAAHLWATDERPQNSVSLLWDPPAGEGDSPDIGKELSSEEISVHAAAIRRHRVANPHASPRGTIASLSAPDASDDHPECAAGGFMACF